MSRRRGAAIGTEKATDMRVAALNMASAASRTLEVGAVVPHRFLVGRAGTRGKRL
jgi:hypothetical protein